MDRFYRAGLELRKVCEEAGIKFREILTKNGKIHQWNFTNGDKLVTYWPTTGTCVSKVNRHGKIDIDDLIPTLNNELGLDITPIYLSSLVKQLLISKKSKEKIMPVVISSTKTRFFMKNDEEFNRVYKYGFKSRKTLTKAYNWYVNNK